MQWTIPAKITIFLVLTFALSALTWVPIMRAGDLGLGGGMYILATMWCPGVAAILTRLITQRDLRGMGWFPRTPSMLGLAYILPVLYALPVYSIAWAAGLGAFDPTRWVVEPELTPVTGLLVPELAKLTSFRNVALISGAVWAVWHMPLMIWANYHGEGTPVWYSLAGFAAMIIALSFIMAWITLKSRSLWPAALLHATHNLFVQAVFDNATMEGPAANWWTGEFGAGLAITIAIAAFLLIRFGGRRVTEAEPQAATA